MSARKKIPTTSVGPLRVPLYFVFNLRPVPWERNVPIKTKGRVLMLKAQRTRDYEARIAEATALQYEYDAPLEGDLIAHLTYYLANKIHGDLDNLTKAVLDGMQGVAFRNDKQIRGLNIHVVYFEELEDGEPRIERTEVILVHRKGRARES
ncbi:MAG: RusA family crossover junction endodeoxyribonuclease [Candidatus Obscuribacterales bacterium]|nr:RusA family crossover junction endodeoxyribonuclease [Candidatus Obscuribacterales bacterium]